MEWAKHLHVTTEGEERPKVSQAEVERVHKMLSALSRQPKEGNTTQDPDHMVEASQEAPLSEAASEPVMEKRTLQAGEFECEVCYEHKLFKKDRLPLSQKKTLNGDVLRKSDCNHGVCSQCMAAYVTARVEENRVFDIRCPHEGCRNELYESDVVDLHQRGLLAESVMNQFANLRAQDYKQRVTSLRDDFFEGRLDAGTMSAMSKNVRLCPRCNIILQKSEGCNSFGCSCGHRFQYDKAPQLFGPSVLKPLKIAAKFGVTFQEAERLVGQGCCIGERVAMQLGIPLEEAAELQRRAKAGDGAAIDIIRAGRQRNKTGQ